MMVLAYSVAHALPWWRPCNIFFSQNLSILKWFQSFRKIIVWLAHDNLAKLVFWNLVDFVIQEWKFWILLRFRLTSILQWFLCQLDSGLKNWVPESWKKKHKFPPKRVHWTLQFVRYLLTIACEEQMQLSIVTIMTAAAAVPASSYSMSQTAKIRGVQGG